MDTKARWGTGIINQGGPKAYAAENAGYSLRINLEDVMH